MTNDVENQEPFQLPEHLTAVLPLAEAVLALSERLDVLIEEDDAKHENDEADAAEPEGPPAEIVALMVEVSEAALKLAAALDEDDDALLSLDEWSQERELLPRIVELPLGLVSVGEFDRALAVARAFAFVAPESFDGDIAIILAEAGKREEALAQLASNAEEFPDSFVTVLKAGAAYEALGDGPAAEASYRKASTLAEEEDEKEEALNQLAGFLEDAGRGDEVEKLL